MAKMWPLQWNLLSFFVGVSIVRKISVFIYSRLWNATLHRNWIRDQKKYTHKSDLNYKWRLNANHKKN